MVTHIIPERTISFAFLGTFCRTWAMYGPITKTETPYFIDISFQMVYSGRSRNDERLRGIHLAGMVPAHISFFRLADPIFIVVRRPMTRHSKVRLSLSIAGRSVMPYANMQRTCAVKRRLQHAVPQALDTKGKTCGLISERCEAPSNMAAQPA